MTGDRRGFTLVELLVVAVLGSLLLLAIYQILLTNQRTFRANAEQVQGQQTVRMALDLMAADLREVSLAGGEITSATASLIEFEVGARFGVVCEVDYGPPVVLTVVKFEEWFGPSDDIVVFAENDVDVSTDDTWIEAPIVSRDTASITCQGREAQDLTFLGLEALFAADSVRAGAPIRSIAEGRYSVNVDGSGTPYLFRNGVRFVGPVAPGGLQLAYYDEDGNSTTTAGDIEKIDITITAQDGTSLTTSVYPRN